MSAPSLLVLTVTNPATRGAVVYIGVVATLNIQLANATGGDIAVSAGATLTIYFPSFYTGADIAAMKPDLSRMSGWTAIPQAKSIQLKYSAAQGTIWQAGASYGFSLANVATQTQQAVINQSMQINPGGMGGAVPPQVQTPLTLIAQPRPGSTPLDGALSVSLNGQGIVYVSADASDPLANQLTLNLSNLREVSLYQDADVPRPSSPAPEVVISFVYGSTIGSLLPDKASKYSAWDIQCAIADLSGGDWSVKPPQGATPSWTLSPQSGNAGMLGTGDKANVSFTFGNIVSFLSPGLTRMVVHCRNFWQSHLVSYQDTVFFLDIIKQSAPITRGVARFDSPQPLKRVASKDDVVRFQLNWVLTAANSAVLLSNLDGMDLRRFSYGTPPPALTYDKTEIVVPGITRSTAVLFTLQAYDGKGGFLNSLQFSGFIDAQMFTDPVDGTVYPVIKIGDQYWMATDLARNTSAGSHPALNPKSKGRVYTSTAATLPGNPEGWRLPSLADYKALIAQLGGPAAAYAALIAGGASGFNAYPTGFRGGDGNFYETTEGLYWTSDKDPGSGRQFVANISGQGLSVTLTTQFDPNAGNELAVRYVRDAR